jgi:DNA invertase Pin-like site-specific DNA recombinase
MKDTENTKLKQAIIYTRVSTDEQAEKGYSLAEQESRLRKYCLDNWYTVAGHYTDDHSAKTFNRPAFQRMLDDVRSKRIRADALIVTKYDRFSRNIEQAYEMKKVLKSMKLELVVVEGMSKNGFPEDILFEAIAMAIPQIENEHRSRNTRKGLRQAQREGRWVSKPPIGYKFDHSTGKPLLIPDERAVLVREAFELFATGLFQMKEVRTKLKSSGLNCSKQQFKNLLTNPLYYG